MTAPQPPDHHPDHDDAGSGPSEPAPRYDFHGEQLDFDPYRFGAPETPPPTWTAPAPGGDPARPPAPGEQWTPGDGAAPPEVRPGDYWQGGGSRPGGAGGGAVFPPPGYRPPPTGPTPTGPPPSGGYPPPQGYPAPGYGPPSGYPTPGGYPSTAPQNAQRGPAKNSLAVAGFSVAVAGCVLFLTSFIAVLIGLTGLGLSIAGYVRARGGAPHRTLAVWGIALSVLAILLGIAFLVYALSQYDFDCLANINGDTGRISECQR